MPSKPDADDVSADDVSDDVSADDLAVGKAVSGKAVSGKAVSGEAVSGEAVSGDSGLGRAAAGFFGFRRRGRRDFGCVFFSSGNVFSVVETIVSFGCSVMSFVGDVFCQPVRGGRVLSR
ncbi:MAG: hypothetical protein V3V75_05145 [Thermoguttaceae bacterium]